MPPRAPAPENRPTFEHVKAHHVSRLLVLMPPWTCMAGVLGAGALLHGQWPGGWPAVLTAVLGCALTAVASVLPHHGRHPVSRWLGPVTMLAVTGWLTAAVYGGISHALVGAWVFGGLFLCVCWDMWLAVRDDAGANADITRAFEPAAERAGLAGLRVLSMRIHEHKLAGVLRLMPGQHVAADVAKNVPYLESGMRLPPGSLQVTTNRDDASHANFTLSDPRKLHNPVLWPYALDGSNPGGSIADPISYGLWQDGDTVEYTVINHHLQLMGATGAGKTMGGAWNEAAETATRHDAAFLGFDITKGEQFFGPLRPCMHGVYTGKDEIMETLFRVHHLVRVRTDYLAARGLTKWEPGCGLTHLTCWFEECPDLVNLLNDCNCYEQWESDVKAGRSGGIRWVLSLQRSDFTQMPTLVRGQLAKMCFGVLTESDASFGLSAIQKEHNASPELWQTDMAGMAYLDAPCIPRDRKSMPLRTWYWGEETNQIAAFAENWPASHRPVDPVTAGVLGLRTAQPAAAAAAATPGSPPAWPGRPNLRIVPQDDSTAGNNEEENDDEMRNKPRTEEDDLPIEVPDSDFGRWKWPGTPENDPELRMTTEKARETAVNWLRARKAAGRPKFTIADFTEILDTVGRSRQWLYGLVKDFTAAGYIQERGGQPTVWKILDV